MARRVAVLALWSGMAGLVWPSVASAHAFAIGREDVPIPIWLFLGAAAAVLVASFAALSVGWRTTRLEREHWRPVPQAISRVIINPATAVVEGAPRLAQLATRFAHTLIPIGLAYLIAHYFSYFFFGEQDQFSYLITNPLGNRSASQIFLAPLSANPIWYVQVGTLVGGHVSSRATTKRSRYMEPSGVRHSRNAGCSS